jgi:hypothetical protein
MSRGGHTGSTPKARSAANWLEANTSYVLGSMKTWGWIVLIVGVLQLTAAFSIWAGSEYGRWIGIGSAGSTAS